MHPARCTTRNATRRMRGFSMVELMITLTVLAVVMIVLSTVMYTAARSKAATANRIESSQAGRVALDLLARDLRSAGYGADLDYATPQPPIAYIDSTQVLINENMLPYPDTTGGGPSAPLALNPAGSSMPRPLNGTAWTPAIRYRTGAETVRWTLDLDNDGAINGNDLSTAAGADAQRTPNPNDFVLVREVWGDSTAGTALNNGGSQDRIALVRQPGAGTTPAMFTVYLKGNSTPWSWANGPVPANQLANIERIKVKVVATSGKPDWKGDYAENLYTTEINSMRNVPQLTEEYVVDGFVFNDLNLNHVKDGSDVGLTASTVRLGSYAATTNSNGYFLFSVSPGTYTLRHTPPTGYGNFTTPSDSFIVTVPPGVTRSFADTALKGGYVNAYVYEDVNKNGTRETSEPMRPNEKLSMSPSGLIAYSNSSGVASMFAGVGGYSVTITLPDSFSCPTGNPATGTMTDGGTATHWFALQRSLNGTIKGKVWHDKNNNGSQNTGEPGVSGVWVGVVSTSSQEVVGFAYTNNNGDYTITLPANSPPATDPYTIQCVPANGFYPVGSSAYTGVYLTGGSTLSGRNFGLNSFQMISLTASRVLSLGTGDCMESDWNGNQTQNAHADQDILLGADANGTDQVSVWFNQYDNSTLFNQTRDYARSAPNAVLAMSVDTLSIDADPFRSRVDLVTGTKIAGAGNFFTWYNQNSKSNEGYLPDTYSQAYRTADNGDVQAVVTGNVNGGAGVDIIVGTKSPTANQGSIELWRSDNAVTPTFSFVEKYPNTIATLGYTIGEVTCMALTKLRSTGQDLVVGTKTGTYTGQFLIFSRVDSSTVFKLRFVKTYASNAVKAITVSEITGDGKPDIVVATQTGTATGRLELWRNDTTVGSNVLAFTRLNLNTTSFVPYSMVAADFGGATATDIAVGFRSDESSYGGGVKIFYCDSGFLPVSGTDPSGGQVVNFAPACTNGNYNYGVKPALPSPPFLMDLAAGVKSSNTTGALVVFIR